MSKILAVDGDPGSLAAIEEILTGRGHQITIAHSGETALVQINAESPDLVILDIEFPDMSGLKAFRAVQRDHPKLPVIVMTGKGTVKLAVEATQLGAFDYQLKPINPKELLQSLDRALECVRLMQQPVVLDPETALPTSDAIIGQSEGMQQVYKDIGHVAQTEATVLIRGESGTGKELVARTIYQHSRRSDKPLLVVNCVAIPEPLLESELFGHERGAFTGAVARRIGKFEQAHGGTVLLDEIGDMPLSIQAKILRVLQEQTFDRLGGHHEIHVSVRILAATHRNLEKAIAEGKFREDLYHRLKVVTIRIPPLREHRVDIPKLTDYFLGRSAAELGIDKPLVSEGALDVLRAHSWRGNVRELAHRLV